MPHVTSCDASRRSINPIRSSQSTFRAGIIASPFCDHLSSPHRFLVCLFTILIYVSHCLYPPQPLSSHTHKPKQLFIIHQSIYLRYIRFCQIILACPCNASLRLAQKHARHCTTFVMVIIPLPSTAIFFNTLAINQVYLFPIYPNYISFPTFHNHQLGKISKHKSPLGGVRCLKGIETFPSFPNLTIISDLLSFTKTTPQKFFYL